MLLSTMLVDPTRLATDPTARGVLALEARVESEPRDRRNGLRWNAEIPKKADSGGEPLKVLPHLPHRECSARSTVVETAEMSTDLRIHDRTLAALADQNMIRSRVAKSILDGGALHENETGAGMEQGSVGEFKMNTGSEYRGLGQSGA